MKIANDTISFEAADIALLSPRVQKALTLSNAAPEVFLSNTVNRAISAARNRAVIRQIALADAPTLAAIDAVLDPLPVKAASGNPLVVSP